MSLQQHIVRQFGRPRGSVGRVAGWVMAHRPSNRARNAWTVDLLGLQPHHRVLEIGYGPGLSIQHAARTVTAGAIVGIDHSTVMRDQAAVRNHDSIEAGRVHLLVGSAENASDLGSDFDAIFSVNVLMFWDDPESVFEGLRKLLKPGGVMATSYQPRHRNARPEDASRMAERILGWMEKTGYEDLRVERLDLRPVPAICVLGRHSSGS